MFGWEAENRIRALEERLAALERQAINKEQARLTRKLSEPIFPTATMGDLNKATTLEFYRYRPHDYAWLSKPLELPIVEAVRLLADHVGVTFTHVPETGASWKVEKKQSKK